MTYYIIVWYIYVTYNVYVMSYSIYVTYNVTYIVHVTYNVLQYLCNLQWCKVHLKCVPICACMHAQLLSRALLLATSWTVARQAPLSMGFSRQEYWSGLPFLPPRDLPNPRTKPTSPALVGGYFITKPLGKLRITYWKIHKWNSMSEICFVL